MMVKACRNQKGFVLAVSMIFLIVMTVLAITAIRRTTLDEKVAGNLRVQNVAFQAAEKALRYCESVLDLRAGNSNMCKKKIGLTGTQATILRYGSEDTPLFPARDPGPDPKDNFPNLWENMANWTGNPSLATTLTAPDLVANVASQPQCLIELWKFNGRSNPGDPPANNINWAYVITARGVGNVNTAVVWVQETLRCGTY
jgi:type IV pilus assembly protein PilX